MLLTLRDAADRIGSVATRVPPGPWETFQDSNAETHVTQANRRMFGVVASPSRGPADYGVAAAEWIAMMDPDVGVAVAEWLRTAAADLWAHGPLCVCGTGCDACDDNLWEPHVRRALVVARRILGES